MHPLLVKTRAVRWIYFLDPPRGLGLEDRAAYLGASLRKSHGLAFHIIKTYMAISPNLWSFFVGVFARRALLFKICIRDPDFWKNPQVRLAGNKPLGSRVLEDHCSAACPVSLYEAGPARLMSV